MCGRVLYAIAKSFYIRKALCACRVQHHLDGPGACPASSAGMRALLALLFSNLRVFTAGCPLNCNAIHFACRCLQRNYEKNLSPSALRGKLEKFAAVSHFRLSWQSHTGTSPCCYESYLNSACTSQP